MGKIILIIDDEPDVVSYLSAILHSKGYEPFSASNADNGFELLKEIKPDLVCLDIMMPRESGISLYKKMHKDDECKDIPVLFISGVVQNGEFDFEELIRDEKIPYPKEFLEKPIDIDQFLDIVNQLTGHTTGTKKTG